MQTEGETKVSAFRKTAYSYIREEIFASILVERKHLNASMQIDWLIWIKKKKQKSNEWMFT